MPEKHNLRSINTGVVGCGFIGRIHVEALRRLGYVNVLALASRSQEIADAKAAELSIPKAYGKSIDQFDLPYFGMYPHTNLPGRSSLSLTFLFFEIMTSVLSLFFSSISSISCLQRPHGYNISLLLCATMVLI